eukprot:CAMPEP_0171957388 /NCGR_PEP_ID=MMETSP0993-20121228/130977_1 /TAXON_ID=483369 /ORGANISM="non described non described, Strain CCMP2098" /LENGTH=59 /DNA_ID=CAMNT_0012604267 /DNA_START=229 /DNA_END=404 /DNA_ORIENTATION=+
MPPELLLPWLRLRMMAPAVDAAGTAKPAVAVFVFVFVLTRAVVVADELSVAPLYATPLP